MVYLDALDLWAVPAVLRACSRGQECHYLIRQHGWSGELAVRCLRFFGRIPLQIESCFETNQPRLYPAFHREALPLLLTHIEPLWLEHIRQLKLYSEDEVHRLARYATIQTWGLVSRMFELLMSVPVQTDVAVIALLQRNVALPALAGYAGARGVVVHGYAAPGRLRLPTRSDFYGDHSRLSPATVVSLIYLVAITASLGPVIAAAAWRWLWRFGKDDSARYDILALAYQPEPSAGFNDFFWADCLKQDHGRKIFAVSARSLTEPASRFYRQRAHRLMSVRSLPAVFLRQHGQAWAEASGTYLKGMVCVMFPVIGSALRGRMPLWLAATLLRIENRTQFMFALMRLSGARVTWAMLEGNEINSLAMTLAASRIGGVCFGTSWSMPYAPRIYDAIARNHVLFVWGERQRRVYQDSNALVRRYVVSGYPTARHYLEKTSILPSRPAWLIEALSRGGRRQAVTFYDNICAKDIIISCDEMRTLFSQLFDWLATRPDVLLVLKTKRHWYRMLDGDIHDRIACLESQGAVLIREEKADIEAGLAADAVLGISSSTLAVLAAAHGKRCVLYDRHDVVADETYPLGLASVMRIASAGDLSAALDCALMQPADTGERGGLVDGFADAEGDRRIAFYMDAVLIGLAKGGDAPAAEAEAAQRYAERWPSGSA